MTDYYSLINRAVARLDKSTGETRRALYDRARAAQANHLRKIDPPLTDSDFERERLALEDAIRRVESVCRVKLLISEGAQQTLSQPPVQLRPHKEKLSQFSSQQILSTSKTICVAVLAAFQILYRSIRQILFASAKH